MLEDLLILPGRGDADMLLYDCQQDTRSSPEIAFWPGSGCAATIVSGNQAAIWSGFERNESELVLLKVDR